MDDLSNGIRNTIGEGHALKNMPTETHSYENTQGQHDSYWL